MKKILWIEIRLILNETKKAGGQFVFPLLYKNKN